jgi:hypothetical protein
MSTAPPQSRFCRLVDWLPPRWLLLVLVCLVIYVRGQVVERFVDSLQRDPDAYANMSDQLARNHEFSIWDDGVGRIGTASRPPLYPLLLAPLNWFDLGSLAFGIGALHAALGAATVSATWFLGRLWGLPGGVCLVACALVTIDPILLAQSVQVMTETLAALVATLAMLSFTWWARSSSMLAAAVAGAVAGLTVLCRGEFLVLALAALIAFPFVGVPQRRAWRLMAFAAWAALVVGPWAVRNYNLTGRPVITTTHGGFTLLLANNPDFYEYLRSAPWGAAWDGGEIYAAQPALGSVSEVEQDWANYRQAFENIRAEPGMFAWSCAVRVARLWNVLPHQASENESTSRRGMRWAVAIWYTLELALAAAGAWFLRGKLWREPWLWGMLLVLSITAVHAFYWTDMRMRAPLVPVVCLTAAYGAAVLACGKRDPSASQAQA